MVLPIMRLHGRNDGCQRVAVIRIAGQRGDMGDELAAFRAMSGRGDADLDAELVGPMRLALADALHFRRVQGIDLGSALTLILRQHAPGQRLSGRAKISSSSRIAVDACGPMSRMTRPR